MVANWHCLHKKEKNVMILILQQLTGEKLKELCKLYRNSISQRNSTFKWVEHNGVMLPKSRKYEETWILIWSNVLDDKTSYEKLFSLWLKK